MECSGIYDPMNSGEFGPEKVIDGNPETRWCGHPAGASWIMIDLGEAQMASKEIVKVRIRFERAFPPEYIIFSFVTLSYLQIYSGKFER